MTEMSFEERSCPLPVIRKSWDDAGDDILTITTEVCGEPLYVTHEESKYLLVGGECDSCGPTWKVECANGHVLLVPDHEADDNYTLIPFDEARTDDALARIVTLLSVEIVS